MAMHRVTSESDGDTAYREKQDAFSDLDGDVDSEREENGEPATDTGTITIFSFKKHSKRKAAQEGESSNHDLRTTAGPSNAARKVQINETLKEIEEQEKNEDKSDDQEMENDDESEDRG
ncbi:hypothetical protein MUCCIDRAFT_115710 [Mucor lusitanicus CBS 277.49]|uniref:Uncharacterized protein n=1 Tax=Mucor lusitanicus CBS 277.49 TaxID=747725 RepID=A0A162Q1Y8_MUCCL|nr:hypothetical protein MUCCIDRAFT_115710 [Mucor lusitanicus CBS 277.49]